MIGRIRLWLVARRLRRDACRRLQIRERQIREFALLLDQCEERWMNPYQADWAPCVAYLSDEFHRVFDEDDKK